MKSSDDDNANNDNNANSNNQHNANSANEEDEAELEHQKGPSLHSLMEKAKGGVHLLDDDAEGDHMMILGDASLKRTRSNLSSPSSSFSPDSQLQKSSTTTTTTAAKQQQQQFSKIKSTKSTITAPTAASSAKHKSKSPYSSNRNLNLETT